MKCPRCNYVSFDDIPRCKKCGFQFKPARSQQNWFDGTSLLPDTPVRNGETEVIHEDDGLKKTVSSIRESLAEIDGKNSTESPEVPHEPPLKVDTDDLKFQVDSSYMDTSRQFPDESEINWEESVSLSNDHVTLPFHDEEPGSTGPNQAETSADRPFTEGDHFHGTLRQISEELKEIEGGPHVPEEALQATEEEPALFQAAAGTVLHPDEDAGINRVGKGGFWIRAMAYLIDTIILEFLSLILIVVGMLAMSISPSGLAAMDEDRIMGLVGPYYLFSTIITILYFTYFHGSIGQTPGKMMCGLKVVRVNGEPLGYGRAFLRWAGYLPSSLIFGLGFLWIAWDRNKQAWHDKIAGTRVIRL